MNYKMMGKFISRILLIEDVFLIPALLISIFCHEQNAMIGFLATFFIILLCSAVLHLFCRNSSRVFHAKEGLVCVGLSWIVISILGCLPFYISREIPKFIDALFETVSGFTTTGSSILPEVEVLSKSILYWRSFTHWLGGMGVLVFLLALNNGNEKHNGFTMHLLRAESPGPNVGKLVPKMKTTAQILYIIYIVLTFLNFLFLLFGGIPVFDAVCTAFGTAGTGGFGIKNDSIASYSPYIQNVCTVFMLLFGVNFSCYYLLLMKQFKNVFQDEELRLYLLIVFGSIVLITYNIRDFYPTLEECIRHAAFQVASITTTTGFATTDFDQWPAFSKSLLLSLMLIGACAGSTGGGFKCGRALLVLKNLRCGVKRLMHPEQIQIVRNNKHMIDDKVIANVNAYLAAYVCIMIGSFLVVSLDNFSTITSLSAVISCMNNIGPGLDQVGATCNFSGFGVVSKLILILDMLAGRLEIFPILILFSRSTWKRR